MRVLVTGGAGFIGSHIADRLLEEGYKVRIMDNLEERVHRDGTPNHIPEGAEFIQGDMRSKDDIAKALKGVDIVFHEAAYQDYMSDYSKFIHTNVVGTALIYEIINELNYPVQKIIIASSQAVYGEGQYNCKEHGSFQPFPRTLSQLDQGEWEIRCPVCGKHADPLPHREQFPNPYNQYALSKYSQELAGLRLGRLLGIPTVALRYSITQGPRQSLYNQYSGICRIFTLRLINGQPPIIYEDGHQLRDYTHIDDVVEANMLVLSDARADYEVFNVGSGRGTTVLEYAQLLAKALGKEEEIQPEISGKYRVGDTRNSVSSIEKLSRLGWKPQKGLEEIFADYLTWVESMADLNDYFTEADRLMRETGVVRKAHG